MKRRDFLKTSVAASAGLAAAPVFIGGMPLTGLGASSGYGHLATLDSDKVLVVVQMAGGNDGLNTVIPLGDPAYAAARPKIGLTYPQDFTGNKPEGYVVISGSPSNGTGLNGGLASKAPTKSFKTMYDEGTLAVVQGVCYEYPNRSHFRATDIWMSGSDANTVLDSGWFGRYLADQNPNYPDVIGPNDDPLAIQIGYSLSRVLYGPKVGMGITISTPDQFNNLVSGHPGQSSTDPPPATFGGDELKYVRTIVEESQQYAQRIIALARAGQAVGQPKLNYPADPKGFAAQLSIVARLIAGGAKTKMYMVYISGFDTHAGQNGAGGQPDLLQYISEGVAAFIEDLKALGQADRVIGMTFSEFGRRVKENGSAGTDHGTSAPMFLFGTNVEGGIFGANPSLTKLDPNQDLLMQYDFRHVYYSILEKWFGASKSTLDAALENWAPTPAVSLPIIKAPNSIERTDPIVTENFILNQNYPNPFSGSTRIEFSVNSYRDVLLKVYAENGREVATLVNGPKHFGTHAVTFDASQLPAGNYLARLECDGGVQTRVMHVVR